MKLVQFRESLKKADEGQLREILTELRKQLFTMRINSSTSHVKDYSQFKKLRRGVARALTELRAREADQVGQVTQGQ